MWIFNFEKDADGKHPYTPLQALDNLTEEEIFNKEERIKYFRSCVKQVIEFYEDNKKDVSEKEQDLLKELSLLAVWSLYNGIHNNLVWLGYEGTDREKTAKEHLFKWLKQYGEINNSNDLKYGKGVDSDLFELNADTFNIQRKKRKIGF
ncbi:hypothetical protein [Burkholderia sp. LMG 13014]|uniref:hypothetical protein n=1 Tax=Burkholderia sp. LMG 13014 TaxID=2709306 RepID=UPI001963F00A|nr:hypothetical protein [Burkholderia sp. LMG 13014]